MSGEAPASQSLWDIYMPAQHRCKKRFLRFDSGHVFTFFNVFLFFQRFSFLKTFIENTI